MAASAAACACKTLRQQVKPRSTVSSLAASIAPHHTRPLPLGLLRPRSLHSSAARRNNNDTTSSSSSGPSTSSSSSSSTAGPSKGTDPGKLYRERQAAGGPFTWRAAALFVVTGVGLYVYFQNEKKKVEERKRQESAAQKVGRPKIGGPFKLTNQYGKEFTHEDLLGKHSLVYFGFTNCPDICPEELDKMTTVVNRITSSHGQGSILPVFITCDPARDNVQAVKNYCKDFHPTLIGLTGSYEDIKQTCKTYRVYFSTPPNAKATDDYLVDHSIFFYLMDPQGQFVDAFGRSVSADDVTAKVDQYMKEWNSGVRRGDQ